MLTIAAKKKHRGIKLNPVERVGMAVVYLICIMAGILTIVPFLYIVAGSFATEKELVERAFFIIPHTFSLNAYKYIIADGSIFRGLANSFFIMIAGTVVNMAFTTTLTKDTVPLDIIQTWFGAPNGWGEVDGKLVPDHQTEEYLECLKWLRKLCEEGLIKKDFPTRDAATKADDLKTQKAGMIVDAIDDGRRVADYFENQGIVGPEMDFVGAVKADENAEPRTMATLGCQGFFVITKAAKTEDDVRKCLDFLDKMNDEEMMTLANYGLQDKHFKLEADGKLTRSHDATLNQEYQALNQLVSYTEYAPNTDPYVTLNETEIYYKQQETIKNNEQYAVSDPTAGILGDSEEYTKNGVALDKIIEDARIQFIVGQIDEEQLKAQWDLWSKSGGDKVIEEVNAVYAK